MVRQWLAKKGITAPHLVMENGSGLSRAERVSAREMAAMLQAAWRSPYSAEFISSMPIAGTDGTMRKRLKTTAMRGEAHVKTGTLNTVRAICRLQPRHQRQYLGGGGDPQRQGTVWRVVGAGSGAAGPVSPAETAGNGFGALTRSTKHYRSKCGSEPARDSGVTFNIDVDCHDRYREQARSHRV